MSKIPRTILIFGEKYQVKIVDKVDDQDSCGSCDSEKQIIRIRSDLDPGLLRITFIHELIHGLMNRIGLSGQIDNLTEEIICDSIAQMIVETMDVDFK